MENNQVALEKLEKNSRQQLLFLKILCGLCAGILICVLVMTLSIAGVAGQVTELADQAKFVMDNLDTVTWELANADIGGMVENMGTLAADSQAIVESAMNKLDAINLEALNQAIEDLADIVEPLANLSNFFG